MRIYRIAQEEKYDYPFGEAHPLQSQIDQLEQSLESQFPGLDLDIWVTRGGYIELARINVPKDMRNQGIGHQVMQTLKNFAQSVNLPIVLRPEPEPRKKKKLMDFYKDVDFVKNKGRNEDYRLSTPFAPSMYWKPKDPKIET